MLAITASDFNTTLLLLANWQLEEKLSNQASAAIGWGTTDSKRLFVLSLLGNLENTVVCSDKAKQYMFANVSFVS